MASLTFGHTLLMIASPTASFLERRNLIAANKKLAVISSLHGTVSTAASERLATRCWRLSAPDRQRRIFARGLALIPGAAEFLAFSEALA